MDGITFVTGLGLPEILLWVLTFAVVFGVLSKLKILSRAPAALISIVVGFMVLLAVPTTLIAVISSMSTGLIAVAIGVLALIALLEVAGVEHIKWDGKGNVIEQTPILKQHSGKVAVVMFIVAAIIFVASGGLGLIGIAALPVFGMGTWLLIIVGAAVLWMLSEAK